jgi:hypothetical protein
MPSPRDTKLDSWKAIGAFLGHDVSTARRWEKETGLPVHRVPGNKRHTVYAYTEELDNWLRGRDEPPLRPIEPARKHLETSWRCPGSWREENSMASIEQYLKQALLKFEQDRREKDRTFKTTDLRLRGARQFVAFLLGEAPEKYERLK